MTIRKNLAAADVLRVACIGLVAWYHFWQQSWLNPGFHAFGHYVNLQQMVRNGYMMVDVMLALSGFLLALPWARARENALPAPSTKVFYHKRFWRIVPSYALAVLLVLFLYALPLGLYNTPGKAVKDILAHATFTHNLFPDLLSATPLLGVLWTVAVEAQFYLIFPLLAIFYKDWPGLTCLSLTLGGLLMRLWVSHQPNLAFWVNQMPCMLDLFACGMAGAAIFAHWEGRPIRKRARWLLAGGAAVCFLCILQVLYTQIIGDYDLVRRYQLMWRLPLGLLTAGFLVCGCLGPESLDRAFGNRVTRVLAAISYNFYIWHQFIATRLKAWHFPPYASENPNQAGEQPWQILYMLCCFTISGLLATAITYLWEKPWHKWGMKRSLTNHPKPAPISEDCSVLQDYVNEHLLVRIGISEVIVDDPRGFVEKACSQGFHISGILWWERANIAVGATIGGGGPQDPRSSSHYFAETLIEKHFAPGTSQETYLQYLDEVMKEYSTCDLHPGFDIGECNDHSES